MLRTALPPTVALTLLISWQPARATAAQEFPRVGIRDTELRQLDSSILGERIEIDVSLPRGYADESARYPAVYVLDAETNFGATSYIAHRLMKNKDIPRVLVVGIAYDTTYDDFYRKRSRDLTPLPSQRFAGSGGAARFARFLREELFPFVDSQYRSRPQDRTLYGHSFGGLFAHYALLEEPGLFQRFVSISPSLWYGNRHLASREEALFRSGRRLEGVVYTAVGALESQAMRGSWTELTDKLRSRSYPGLVMKSELLAHENHRSIFGVAFTNGLRYVFSVGLPRADQR
jgi:predicted alpha/beta superfamily hydrolase